jgi:hypothetical protein
MSGKTIPVQRTGSPKVLAVSQPARVGTLTSLGKVSGNRSEKSSVEPATLSKQGQPAQRMSGQHPQPQQRQLPQPHVVSRTTSARGAGAGDSSASSSHDAQQSTVAAHAVQGSSVGATQKVAVAVKDAGQPASVTAAADGCRQTVIVATGAQTTPVSKKRPASGSENSAGKKPARKGNDQLSTGENTSDSEIEVDVGTDDVEQTPLVIAENEPQEAQEMDTADWNVAGRKKRTSRKAKALKKSTGPTTPDPSVGTSNEAQRTVFVQGRNGLDLVKQVAYNQADRFKSAVAKIVGGDLKMQLVGQCIKIVASDEQQVEKLLQVTELDGLAVTISPQGRNKKSGVTRDNPNAWAKGVIKRIPRHVETELVKQQTGAVWAQRIMRKTGEIQQPTGVVIIAFSEKNLPENVNVGLAKCKVYPYIPLPVRCTKCQKYGHKAVRCKATAPICAKCSKAHATAECTATGPSELKCTNCGQPHSSAYRGCRRYQQVSKTLTVSAKQNLTYSEAAKKLAKSEKEKKRENAKRATDGSRSEPASTSIVSSAAPTSAQRATASSWPTPAEAHPAPSARGGGARPTGGQPTQTEAATRPVSKAKVSAATQTSAPSNKSNEGTPAAVPLETSESLFKKLQEILQPLVIVTSWLLANLPTVPEKEEQLRTVKAHLQQVAATAGIPQMLAESRQRRNSGQQATSTPPAPRAEPTSNAVSPAATVSLRPGGGVPKQTNNDGLH